MFARDRADLGPGHAAQLAAAEAARYAEGRPLGQVLADLRGAWTVEQRCLNTLAFWEPERDILRQVVALEAGHAGEFTRLKADCRQTARAAERARARAAASARTVDAHAERGCDSLLAAWDGERDAASTAARVVLDGPGRLGLRRTAVARAAEQLSGWADRGRPLLPDLPTDPTQLARVADWFDDRPALWTAFDTAARRAAEHHPEHAGLIAAADAAEHAHDRVRLALTEAHRRRDERLEPFGLIAFTPDPQGRLTDLQRDLAATPPATDRRPRAPHHPARRAGPPRPSTWPAGQRTRRGQETRSAPTAAGTRRPSAPAGGPARLRGPTCPRPGRSTVSGCPYAGRARWRSQKLKIN